VTLTAHCVRAAVEIDAPIDRIWRILTDIEGYGDWNPFTPQVKTTLAIGDPIHLTVRLVGDFNLEWVETVTRNAPYTLGWEMKLGTRTLLHAERLQVLTAIDDRRTHYVTEDCLKGWLRPIVIRLFGGAMERGFLDCALGLKNAAERGLGEVIERKEEG